MQRLAVVIRASILGLVLSVGALGLLSSSDTLRQIWAAPAAPTDVVVSINDFYFDPPLLTVSVGTTVVWLNQGSMTHTVSITGSASSGDIGPGAVFSHTFNTKGAFGYQCLYHPEMQGGIAVVDADQVPIDLSVNAWHDQLPAAGARLDYHVSFANHDWSFGTSAARLTVTLPGGSALVTSTLDGNPFPPTTQIGPMLVYMLGALGPSHYAVVDLTVDLPNTLKVNDLVMLTANVSSSNPDPEPANGYSEDSQRVPGANLGVSTRPAFDSPPFVPGGVVTYAVTYYNQSAYIDAASVVLTDRLPVGVAFQSALNDDGNSVTPIVPSVQGSDLRFTLGTLTASSGGQLLIRAQLSPTLFAKTILRNLVWVSTATPETTYEDNSSSDEQSVVPVLPDLWVELRSSTDGEIDGYQTYWTSLGNAGPQDTSSVTVTLSVPIQLTELTFGLPPDQLITRTLDYLATWYVGTLAADSWGNALYASGRISVAGAITAVATITSTGPEADPTDNTGQASDVNVELLMPVIEAPSTAIVGSQPVFYGLGHPGATVTLFVSGTMGVQGHVLAQSIVNDYSRWVLTPTAPLTLPGWYWFTMTQQLPGRTSPATGVGNFVTDSAALVFDTNSMVRYFGTRPFGSEGEPIGGINQPLGWQRNITYTLGARLTRCEPFDPISPTLQVLWFNEDGLMIGHETLGATYTETVNGYVEFEFGTPGESLPFELFVNYYCPVPATVASMSAIRSQRPSGWWQDLKNWFGCWQSLGCDKPDPPQPPNPGCPGCTPIQRPRPRPKPIDPDGFVYDCSMVRSGMAISQSIITQAWVTATQRAVSGNYVAWNALDFDQVNPQYTGPLSAWNDKVPRLGYFSFLVPAGDYRLLATAPGYLPFQSPVLRVTNAPVTFNIPLKRPGDLAGCTPPARTTYLPVIRR